MELVPLPEFSKQALISQSVPPKVRRAIRLVVTCLEEVCAGVADDCSTELRHDDSTSEGQLRWRRCRNMVKKLLDAQAVPGLEDAEADVTDNALQVRIGDCAVSFYSSRNGIDRPDLTGPSKTKQSIVSEMQGQLDGLEAPSEPTRLVVIYEADQDGLAAAAVGMMRSSSDWAWRFSAYERRGLGIAMTDTQREDAVTTYEDEPEPELGEFEIITNEAEHAEDDQ